jgi:hypothetical protein
MLVVFNIHHRFIAKILALQHIGLPTEVHLRTHLLEQSQDSQDVALVRLAR